MEARGGGLILPMPGLDDAEGERLPEALPPVVDAHVHLFPDRVFDAIFRWFDAYAWPIRYKLHAPGVIDFLLSRGVSRVVALHYAHKPGMARALNAYIAELCRAEPRVIGLATVFPGEEGAKAIVEEAFAAGLAGVKLHCHVQRFAVDDEAVQEICEACIAADRPMVIHAGRAPISEQYACEVHAICGVARVERILRAYPALRLCVPHLGMDEFDDYERLLTRYDNLWLDTTMAVAEFFPGPDPARMLEVRPERVMYGTDFPYLPYAWDREIRRIAGLGIKEERLAQVLGGTARGLFGIG